jgi:putative receptor
VKKKAKARLTLAVLLSLSVCAGGEAVHAKETTETTNILSIPDVVVTATRTQENVQTVPAGVTVITAEDMKKYNYMSLKDALKQVTGIYVDPTFRFPKDGVMLRGMSGENILILFDGQPINNSFDGGINWDTIPLGQIARVEIVRGAGSSLYGGHAVAGVVNIITKKSEAVPGTVQADLNIVYGSNASVRREIGISGAANEKFKFHVGYEKRSSHGYRGHYTTTGGETSGTSDGDVTLPRLSDGSYIVGGRGRKEKTSDNLYLDLSYDLTPQRTLTATYMHGRFRYGHRDPFTYLKDAHGKSSFSGTFRTQNGDYVTVTPDDYFGYYGEREQNIYKLRYSDKKAQLDIGVGLSDIVKDGYSTAYDPTSIDWSGEGDLTKYPSKNYTADVQKVWDWSDHRLVAGLTWMKEKMTYTRYPLTRWKDWGTAGVPNTRGEGATHTTALYVQDRYVLSDRWNVYAGLRFDNYKKEGGRHTIGRDQRIFGGTSYSELSPKIAFEYMPNAQTTYYVSYGHSFNPPPIYKLYRRSGNSARSIQANPDLKPEKSDTFELGYKRKVGDATSFDLTLFRIRTKDAIAIGTVDRVRAYRNVYKRNAKGIEAEVKQRFSPRWSAYCNYTFESAEDVWDGKGERDWGVPKHLFHLGAEYTHGKLHWGVDAQYVAARQKPNEVTGEYYAEEAFFTLNTTLGYDVNDQLKLQVGVDNVFDRTYYAYEAASGRTYQLGVQYQF